MWGRLSAGVVASALLAWPTTASAHRGNEFWSKGRAEQRVLDRYGDVVEVICDGFGTRSGRRYFKHFDCSAFTAEDREITFVLHVRSRFRFIVAFT